MRTHIQACINTYTHAHTRTCVHEHTCTCTHTYTCACTQTNKPTHTYIHTCTYIHMHTTTQTCMHVHKQTNKQVYVYVQTYQHTYIHTHTHTRAYIQIGPRDGDKSKKSLMCVHTHTCTQIDRQSRREMVEKELTNKYMHTHKLVNIHTRTHTRAHIQIGTRDGEKLKNALTNQSIVEFPVFTPGNFQKMNLAGYSSRGPTSDGRLKPDVLCPGCVHVCTCVCVCVCVRMCVFVSVCVFV